MHDDPPRPDRFEVAVLAVVYVLPLSAAVLFLAAVGLPGLALGLLAAEAGVSAAVVANRRPEGSGRSPLAVALAVLAVLSGAAAAALVVAAPG